MSLSQRLILAILALILLIMVAGSILAVRGARIIVQDELDKNSNLGLDLFSIAVINSLNERGEDLDTTLQQYRYLNRIRTLNVAVTQPNQTLIQFPPSENALETRPVPGWFASLVAPTPKEYHRRLVLPGRPPVTIRVIPDPSIEIFQAWHNMRLMLVLMSVFALVAAPLIWLVIRFGLKPLDQVIDALGVVRAGDYRQRLPVFRLTEINSLAQRFNHMSEVLQEQKEENAMLHRQLLAVQENERRYLARELHDELGQSITGIKSLAVSIARDSPQCAAPAESIRGVCDQMHQAVRGMINLLRPAVLDELGLRAALDKLVDDWNSHHQDAFCSLDVRGDLAPVGEEDAVTIYRVVQESLTNVARHADAEHVAVRLDVRDGALALEIDDDGKGIDAKEIYHGRGLPGIRERIQSRGGSFQVDSAINHGVLIRIHLPLQSTDDPGPAGR